MDFAETQLQKDVKCLKKNTEIYVCNAVWNVHNAEYLRFLHVMEVFQS